MSLRALFQNPQSRYLLLTGFLSFLLIGALQAMYGPAFVLFREAYGVSDARVGLTVSLHFLGSVVAILLTGFLVERAGYRVVLSGAAGLMVLGALGVAFSPGWAVTLLAVLVAGFGFGAIDIGVNVLFVQSFGSRGAAALNLLNAMFGLGAVLGPLLVAALLSSGLALPFGVIAFVAALILLLFTRISTPPTVAETAQPLDTSLLWRLAGFILFYLFYVGTETGTGSWIATHLTPALGVERAAGVPALFWGAITLGRLVAAPLTLYVKPATMVFGAAALGTGALALSHIVPAAPFAYALTGLFLAPIFPTGLVWLQETFPRRAARATSLVVASASFGGVIFPPLVGVVVEASSSHTIPTVLTVLALLCATAAGLLWRATRPARGGT